MILMATKSLPLVPRRSAKDISFRGVFVCPNSPTRHMYAICLFLYLVDVQMISKKESLWAKKTKKYGIEHTMLRRS